MDGGHQGEHGVVDLGTARFELARDHVRVLGDVRLTKLQW